MESTIAEETASGQAAEPAADTRATDSHTSLPAYRPLSHLRSLLAQPVHRLPQQLHKWPMENIFRALLLRAHGLSFRTTPRTTPPTSTTPELATLAARAVSSKASAPATAAIASETALAAAIATETSTTASSAAEIAVASIRAASATARTVGDLLETVIGFRCRGWGAALGRVCPAVCLRSWRIGLSGFRAGGLEVPAFAGLVS